MRIETQDTGKGYFDLLIFVGGKHYPTIQSFLDEANKIGISRRLHKLPHNVIAGKSTAYLAHEQKNKCEKCGGSGQLKQSVKTREIPVEYQGDTYVVEEFSLICQECKGIGYTKNPVIFASFIIPGVKVYLRKLPENITDISSVEAKLYALHMHQTHGNTQTFNLEKMRNNKDDQWLIQDLNITPILLKKGAEIIS